MEDHEEAFIKFLSDCGITKFTKLLLHNSNLSTVYKINKQAPNGKIESFILKILPLSHQGIEVDKQQAKRGDTSGTQGYASKKKRASEEFKIMNEHSGKVNILKVYQAGESPGGKWYYMLCEFWGEDLLKRASKKAVEFAHVADWATQLVKILKYCEKNIIYHGDLKPENIVINETETIKLIDFGISTVFPDETYFESTGTVSNILGFSRNYMAPEYFWKREERILGKDNIKIFYTKIDVYGFGMVIYQLASGKGPDALKVEMEYKVQGKPKHEQWLKDKVKNLKGENPDAASKKFIQILLSSLATDPQSRKSFADLEKSIEEFNATVDTTQVALPIRPDYFSEESKDEESKEEVKIEGDILKKINEDMGTGEEENKEFEKMLSQVRTSHPRPVSQLEFNGCILNARLIKEIADAMKANKTVETFSITEHPIQIESIIEIADMLKVHPKLKVLNLMFTAITDQHIGPLCEGLKSANSLETLFLSGNQIRPIGAKILADFIATSPALSSIILNNNILGDEGVKYLVAGFIENGALSSIYLAGNKITNVGAKDIAIAIKANPTLFKIILRDNQIESEGGIELAKAIGQLDHLKILNLDNNSIGASGAKELSKQIQNNERMKLIGLYLQCNSLGEAGMKELAPILSKSASLMSFCVNNNKFGDNGAKELARHLQTNTGLQRLWVEENEITDSGAAAIEQAAQKCETLQKLWIRANQIGEASMGNLEQIAKEDFKVFVK
jgi:serine/threonine protein kinase